MIPLIIAALVLETWLDFRADFVAAQTEQGRST